MTGVVMSMSHVSVGADWCQERCIYHDRSLEELVCRDKEVALDHVDFGTLGSEQDKYLPEIFT